MTISELGRQARGVLVIGHVLAVLVLSLPGPAILTPSRWKAANARADFAGWSHALQELGVDTDPARLQARLRVLAGDYVAARGVVAWPFERYAALSGARQGWTMFASPQRHPAEVHVDVHDAAGWRPAFRPRSDDATLARTQLDQNRVRKLSGRFAREFRPVMFEGLARYLAARAFDADPAVDAVRVRLYRYAVPPPEEARRGVMPDGSYREGHVLRRGDVGR